MKLPLLKLLCACAALGAFAARAQNHTAQQIARDPAAAGIDFSADDRPWSGQAELTFLSTVGNTETLSTGAKASGKRNWQFWALMARGEYLQTRDKGATPSAVSKTSIRSPSVSAGNFSRARPTCCALRWVPLS